MYPAIIKTRAEIAILNTVEEFSLAAINPHTIAAITAIPVENFRSDLTTPHTPLVLYTIMLIAINIMDTPVSIPGR
jgi:hypothetical protein